MYTYIRKTTAKTALELPKNTGNMFILQRHNSYEDSGQFQKWPGISQIGRKTDFLQNVNHRKMTKENPECSFKRKKKKMIL